MWIASQGEIAEILERFFPSLCGDQLVSNVTPQHLNYFDVEEMRRMQGFGSRKDAAIDLYPSGSLKKPLDSSRRIQDNHRASRSRRTASFAENGPATRGR